MVKTHHTFSHTQPPLHQVLSLSPVLLLFLICFLTLPAPAQAQVLNNPVSQGVSDTFRIRDRHPVTGRCVPHRGLDFRTPNGTPIVVPPGANVIQRNNPGGYGLYVIVDYGNGVTERYAHLQSYDPATRTIYTNNSGRSTGPHLHYEIRLNDSAVDPQLAWGQDLSDPAVRNRLLADADTRIGQAAVTAACGSQPPLPPSSPPVPIAGTPIPVPPPFTSTADHVAAGGEVEACAVDTWNSLVSRASMETAREIAFNQRFIVKPDSVLEYSCFEEFVPYSSRDAALLFSESDFWDPKPVDIIGRVVELRMSIPPGTLEAAVRTLVLDVVDSHLQSTFAHSVLGGKIPPPTGNPCSLMFYVWDQAKCINEETDIFYRFEELVTYDPRDFPDQYLCAGMGISEDLIDAAYNVDGTYVERSDIPLIFEEFLSPASDCTTLFTGVTAHVVYGSTIPARTITYRDGLCLNPGCSYQADLQTSDAVDEGEGECRRL